VQLAEPLATCEVLVIEFIPCSLSIIQLSCLCLSVTVKGGVLQWAAQQQTEQAGRPEH
jgi:hypothetical protein